MDTVCQLKVGFLFHDPTCIGKVTDGKERRRESEKKRDKERERLKCNVFSVIRIKGYKAMESKSLNTQATDFLTINLRHFPVG